MHNNPLNEGTTSMLGTTALANVIFAFADTAGATGYVLIQIVMLCLIIPLVLWGQRVDKRENQNVIQQAFDKLRDDLVTHRLREHQLLSKMARIYRQRAARKKRI